MAVFIPENIPFFDIAGKPIVNGKIYIGEVLGDPKINAIIIYADRELTIVLANPQFTDSFGRSLNKIWLPGRYSILVENSNEVQKFIDLDAGTTPQSGVTTLTGVQFADDIVAQASLTITGLVDKEIYVYKSILTNTGPMTLTIDATPTKAMVKYGGSPMIGGDVPANTNVFIEYNSATDDFNMLSTLPLLSQGALDDVLTSTGDDAIWKALPTTQVTVPIGGILAWPKTDGSLPDGFLECDGSFISDTDFSDLFGVIGVDYGNIGGVGTFDLPDLRGEFIRGFNNMSSNDPDAASRTDRGDGATGDVVGTKQGDEFKSHEHTQSSFNQDDFDPDNIAGDPARTTLDTIASGSTGGNETRPRNVYMMYIIKF